MKTIYLKAGVISTILLASGTSLLNAQSFSPVAPARGFNVFTSDAVTLVAADTHGPVAAGGNLKLDGQTVLVMNNAGAYPYGAGNSNNYGLVVNVKVLYSSGNVSYVNQGYIRLGDTTGTVLYDKDFNNSATNLQLTAGSLNSNPRVQLQRNQPAAAALEPHGINFNTAFDSLRDISSYINSYDTTAPGYAGQFAKLFIPAGPNPRIVLTPGKVNIITLTGTELNNLNNRGAIIFDNHPDETTPIVWNIIAPGNFSWNNFNPGGLNESDGQYILWNFYNTDTINLTGGPSIYGTILAPNAYVNKAGSNNNNGQIISKSLRIAYGEIHYYLFKPQLPGNTPLPLSGLQLHVQTGQNNEPLLRWETLNEQDMVSFTVQRSTDGKKFEGIEAVPSAGNGDHQYKWQDNNLPARAGQLFYRIAAKDLAGNASYSNVSMVRLNDFQKELTIWPNPFSDALQLSVDDKMDYNYQIMDVTGHLVKSGQVSNGRIAGLEQLPPAAYWLLVWDDQKKPLLQQQILKQ